MSGLAVAAAWGHNADFECEVRNDTVLAANATCDAWPRSPGDGVPAAYAAALAGDALERFLAPAAAVGFARLQRVADKLQSGGRVRLAIVGGSVPYGVGCDDESGRSLQRCAWPGVLGRSLCAAFPGADVRITDLTVPATTTRTFLGRAAELLSLPAEPVDLFIVDYNLNDRAAQTGVDARTLVDVLTRRGSGVLFLETLGSVNLRASATQRKKVHKLHQLCDFRAGAWTQLGVPWVSYRDAVWPMGSAWGGAARCFDSDAGAAAKPGRTGVDPKYAKYVCWDGLVHPTWGVHRLIGEALATLLVRRGRGCAVSAAKTPKIDAKYLEPLPPPRGLCESPETALSAAGGPAAFPPASKDAAWRFGEDVAGKPGWLSSGEATISFDVGAYSNIIVSYLRTYDSPKARMMAATATLVCGEARRSMGVVDGAWADRVSLEQTFEWRNTADAAAAPCRVEIETRAPAATAFPVAPLKFKLVGLVAC
ncbi:hypothetical protein M885DRAFT_620559 [Pelagophyceae sp. CCMP2097]|nr:hypothetical protein M885DRAFT_620559 [Pelagophyceae sp. CCMP2097]